MTSMRMPLALVLSAMLFVTAGFAATKKFQRNDRARGWSDLSLQNGSSPQNDLSLQNGDLRDPGSSVSGGSPGFQFSDAPAFSGSPLPYPLSSPDNWKGGTGNWSNAGQW